MSSLQVHLWFVLVHQLINSHSFMQNVRIGNPHLLIGYSTLVKECKLIKSGNTFGLPAVKLKYTVENGFEVLVVIKQQHGFNYCQGLRLFLCPMLMTNEYVIFIIYSASIKFNILIIKISSKHATCPSQDMWRQLFLVVFCTNVHVILWQSARISKQNNNQ